MEAVDEKSDAEAKSKALRRRHLSRGAVIVGLLGIVFFLVGLSGGQYQGKLSSVEKNDNSAFLPASAQSTKVANEAELFQTLQTVPGFIVYQRAGGLTPADRNAIAAEAQKFGAFKGVDSAQVGQPQYSADGTTASVAVPLIGKNGNVSVTGNTLADQEKAIIKAARAGVPAGLVVHSAGPGGLLASLIDSFSGIDGTLLIAALLVVIAVLLVVYRSPILWFFPMLGAVLALGTASLIIYYLVTNNVLTLNGQSTGILSVLVLGAGTDYALLLTSRYREELHNFESRIEAMKKAWKMASTAIAASGFTVILGLMTLTLGELNSDRSLGPVCALGIVCTVLVMLTFLPLALTIMPRKIFWPRVPKVDHEGDLAKTGPWSRIAAFVGRNDRRSWVSTTIALGICALGLLVLNAGGLSTTDGFTNHPDAVIGEKIFEAHFPQGSGAPAQITANVSAVPAVIAAVSKVPGVSSAPGAVCVAPDYAKLAAVRASRAGEAEPKVVGCLPSQLTVSPQNGRLLLNANINYAYDTKQAYQTVQRIRDAVAPIPGAHALVGGQAAVNYDTNLAAAHDRNLIIPIVMVVILVILMLLLRAVVAPLLLVTSVALSFAASLGISAVVFNDVFHYAGADPSYPLFVFVFLVALGVDYNIFLMTRVREETLTYGTKDGVLRGLAVTGGVITSAGVVLAATFAVLRVIPLVFLSELGFTVALGVLLDTIVVRSILVPALSHDIGKRIWWPSKLAKATD